ncbi:hypothetical protein D9M69_510440 [compost metagenome]
MTRKLLTTCAALCLLLSAGCTSAPKPPIPPPTTARQDCPLTPCRLPGRAALAENEDWRLALDAVEAELKLCAAQVIDCMRRQAVQQPVQ